MNIWVTVMIWAVAGIFSTSFRLLSTTRTQQASEVFIIVIYSFLVYIEQSLPAKGTPSLIFRRRMRRLRAAVRRGLGSAGRDE